MATKTKKSVNDAYLKLVMRFPLERIRDDRHLTAAHKVIDELSMIDEDDLSEGQQNYLLALDILTSAYEAEAFNEITKNASGVDVLKHLAEEHGLSAGDVGRIIGQQSVGAKLLNGSRRIGKEHASALGQHFGVPAELFLR